MEPSFAVIPTPSPIVVEDTTPLGLALRLPKTMFPPVPLVVRRTALASAGLVLFAPDALKMAVPSLATVPEYTSIDLPAAAVRLTAESRRVRLEARASSGLRSLALPAIRIVRPLTSPTSMAPPVTEIEPLLAGLTLELRAWISTPWRRTS